MKNPSPISPSKPPGQVLYPARFKYKPSLSTNLFPDIKPKLAHMQSNSTDFTISNLAKFGDWQQNLKLPSSQIASLLNRVQHVTFNNYLIIMFSSTGCQINSLLLITLQNFTNVKVFVSLSLSFRLAYERLAQNTVTSSTGRIKIAQKIHWNVSFLHVSIKFAYL